ncbi:MAG: 50S ribosomal protein L9 [Candidatus Omnitrophota bacterium]|nr:50S ribosomal protein L9 [Candidatus Omnitrophota bacterium]MBU1894364.1 50S ribosomal protein L9 [Candidatus Omnitrophota bacterium]
MKVILLKDVDKVGAIGDELIVKDGYARNYLIPQKLGIESNAGAVRVLEQKKKERERREKKIKEECLAMAEKMKGLSCTVSMEAGENDKLFGAVTAEMIADVLFDEGIEVDKRKIVLEEPIKALGVYNVEIRLHPEVKSQVRIWIVKK